MEYIQIIWLNQSTDDSLNFYTEINDVEVFCIPTKEIKLIFSEKDLENINYTNSGKLIKYLDKLLSNDWQIYRLNDNSKLSTYKIEKIIIAGSVY